MVLGEVGVELTRTMARAIEYWPTMDPSVTKGSRETILTAYRELRHMVTKRIKDRFGLRPRLSGWSGGNPGVGANKDRTFRCPK